MLEAHDPSEPDSTKSACLSIAHADGKEESIQYAREVDIWKVEDVKSKHVDVRKDHLKNNVNPMTHSPNASIKVSGRSHFDFEGDDSVAKSSVWEAHDPSKPNSTKSACLSIGHADGKEESMQYAREVDTCEVEDAKSKHVDVRKDHLKNNVNPMTHSPNASMKFSGRSHFDLEGDDSVAKSSACGSEEIHIGNKKTKCEVDVTSDIKHGSFGSLEKDRCTKSVCSCIGHADGKDESMQYERKVDVRKVKDAKSKHVDVRKDHLKNNVNPMTHPPNASMKAGDEKGAMRRKKWIRLPSVRERKRAKKKGRIHAYGIRNEEMGFVCLDENMAQARKEGGTMKLFDESVDLSRNIRAASKWVRQCNFQTSTSVDNKEGANVRWDISAAPFYPIKRGVSCCCKEEEECVTNQGPRLVKESCAKNCDRDPGIALRELLNHPQVSNVKPVSGEVRHRMDGFKKCGHDTWRLDLKGSTAGQIQRQLRIQLVEDLKQGSDEAAFVCKQLGIDSVPRADQLELMIAAMPGVAQLEFKGLPAKSGLDMDEWRKWHATHCSKGCTKDEISEDCYFKIVHHFLLCGFDPKLCKGMSWKDFKKKYPAYVDMWRGDEERCRAAWKKWTEGSEGLMSEPVIEEPDFAVPILPATRSKHKWRYLKYGTPYKIRLCLDLKATGVNESTEDWKFRYKALDDIAASVEQGDWLASVDISRFYLRLPAGENLRKVQWVQDPESYAHNAKLNNKSKRKAWRQLNAIGFGLKTAPAWASVVSAELVRILKKAGVRVVGCFIDDLLIAGRTRKLCQRALNKAISIMQKLGLPANEKTVLPKSPDEGIVFLGVHIRTADMRFTISEEHRVYAMDRVSTVLEQGTATKADLASIAGVLNWISFVFIPGRPRRQIIYDAARLGAGGEKSDVVVLEGALLRQLQWWRNALKHANFVGSRIWDMHASPNTLLVTSDASGEDGWGACVAGFHFVGPWPKELQDEHMLFKEIVPVTIVIALLSKKLSETVFGVAVDNTGVAFAVNKLSCRDRITLRMLQQITSDLDEGGHTVLGAHIRRHRNTHTDAMSHALPKYLWNRIVKAFQHGRRVQEGGYWIFPFVAQQLSTGECVSGCFKMRRSLFAKLLDVSDT